jgi:hypothetical protein
VENLGADPPTGSERDETLRYWGVSNTKTSSHSVKEAAKSSSTAVKKNDRKVIDQHLSTAILAV